MTSLTDNRSLTAIQYVTSPAVLAPSKPLPSPFPSPFPAPSQPLPSPFPAPSDADGRPRCAGCLCTYSHFGNEFSAAFAATLSTTLKARKISTASTDDADEETVSPAKEKLDRKPSFYRRLSQRDPPGE